VLHSEFQPVLALTLVCRLSPYFFGASDSFASYKLDLVRCFTQGAGSFCVFLEGYASISTLHLLPGSSPVVEWLPMTGINRKKKLISRHFQASWPFVLVALKLLLSFGGASRRSNYWARTSRSRHQHFLAWVPLLRLTHLLILRTIVSKHSSALNMRRIAEKADQNHFRILRACSGTCQPRIEVSIRPFLRGQRSLLGFQVSFGKIT
jgi:hypothetical protein